MVEKCDREKLREKDKMRSKTDLYLDHKKESLRSKNLDLGIVVAKFMKRARGLDLDKKRDRNLDREKFLCG